MGHLELTKRVNPKYGKRPVDWKRTVDLWAQDEECYRKRQVVRVESRDVYKILWNRRNSCSIKVKEYTFRANRTLKYHLKKAIRDGDTDAVKQY